jgi:hypothetical protein
MAAIPRRTEIQNHTSPLAPFGRFCETFARRHFAALAIVPVLFVRHGDTLTMGDVRERQASWEAEHTEASA